MEKSSGRDLSAILLAGFSALAILAFLAGGMFSLVGGITDWQETHDTTLSLLPAFLSMAAFALAAAIVGRSGWLALSRLRNKPEESARMRPLSFWVGLALFGGWILSILIAVLLSQRPILQWFSLPFYLMAAGLPIYILLRLGTGGLGLGSKLRAWGTFSSGMTLAPFLSGLGELAVLLILLVLIGVFMGLDPQRLEAVRLLAEQLQTASTQEELITLLAPLISNPLTLVAGLFFLSIVTPLIEEIAKSLPVWMAWRRLETPGQGFALGALSGAGFGLIEGLLVSANPGETWGVTLSVRAASSLMHILTSALVGWGIGISAQQKRAMPALARYLLGMSIHGIWNACVLIIVYASANALLAGGSANPAMLFLVFAMVGVISLFILAAPLLLWTINRRLQTPIAVPPLPENIETPSTENMVI